MAYTYNDFTKAANDAKLINQFSTQDLQAAQRNPEFGMSLLGLMKDNSSATTAEQRLLATEAANQLRKNYGVYNTGKLGTDSAYAGSYGSKINDLMGNIDGYGSFDYKNQNGYQQLLDKLTNQQPFAYNAQEDPSYSAYKKAYLREGERASADAMAQAAAASGGRVSSYAQTAAQQAGNYYAGQLADVIPTLEQNAYSRYLDDFNNSLSSLNALQSDREFDYEKWMNEYNMLQNSLGNYQTQDETDYQRYLDALSQQQQAYENAMKSYQLLGYATPEVAEILGISASSGNETTGSGGRGNAQSGTDDDESGLTVDVKSIDNLGYGPLSATQLNKLVESGKVKEVTDGNTIRFENTTKKTGTTNSTGRGGLKTPIANAMLRA